MSIDLQVDGVDSQRTVVISDVNPCDPSGDNIDNSNLYAIKPSNITNATNSVVTFTQYDGSAISPSWDTTGNGEHANKILICISGQFIGKSYEIISNGTNTLTLRGNHHSTNSTVGIRFFGDQEDIFITEYYTIVHTAESMYNYCLANNEAVIALTCSDYKFSEGSTESPQNYSNHTNFRLGTGMYTQSGTLSGCDIWDQNPLVRSWINNSMKYLLYQWHNINNTNAKYLIITFEYEIDGIIYHSNDGFVRRYDADNDLSLRGYLKGFPMTRNGTFKFSPNFTMDFKEAWDQ